MMTTNSSGRFAPWGPFTNDPDQRRESEKPPSLPKPPPWRYFDPEEPDPYDGEIPPMPISQQRRAINFRLPREGSDGTLTTSGEELRLAVNAAIHLRRPLLVTGTPGSGKTSLAYAIAHELELGRVLTWPITPRCEITEGLFRYDALDRLRDSQRAEAAALTSDFITLGPLGTAFLPFNHPRVLLIDEIDKSDIQLPNELLNLFEEGYFEIPPLRRAARQEEGLELNSGVVDTDDPNRRAKINKGIVKCRSFPIVVMTSNRERDFPAAFYRRCIRVEMPAPTDPAYLLDVVSQHFKGEWGEGEWEPSDIMSKIMAFLDETTSSDRAIDQLLNALHLLGGPEREQHSESQVRMLQKILFKPLN